MAKEGKISSAQRNLDKIIEAYITLGDEKNVERFLSLLQRELRDSADADMALNNLQRFIEATFNKTSLLNDLTNYPHLLEILIKTFSASQYLADILVRDPELFRWLTTTEILTRTKTKDELLEEATQTVNLFKTVERKINALKRLYRREILRIGVRDVLGEACLMTVTQELSDLADAIISATCTVAMGISKERFGRLPETEYAVIGLGKLGGSELNYSSDIDIIFVYNIDGEIEDAKGKPISHHEFFNLFAERFVQLLTEHTQEGHLYRVDVRLRPDGKAGPLARSMSGYLTYYETRGELWERQMLIKARVVAGDMDFGNRFLRQLEPFIYPRTFFKSPLEEIARIKSRIEATHQDEHNIKLQAGGIRDIEFIVQALQLLNGGRLPEVRERNTLKAIEKLEQARLLESSEAKTLSDAYTLFRNVEHRLQMMHAIQTHTLPTELKQRAILAKRVGFKNRQQFESALRFSLEATRKIFDSVFKVKFDYQASDVELLLERDIESDRVESILKNYGFTKFKDVLRSIKYLANGMSLTEQKEFDIHVRNLFHEIAPALLDEISRSISPDTTLSNLEKIVRSIKVVEIFYGLLKEEKFRKLILTVCSYSPRFSNQIARNEQFLDILFSQDALFQRQLSTVNQQLLTFNLHQLKNFHELRIGIRNLLKLSTFEEMARELTDVARFVFNAIYQEMLMEHTLDADIPFAVIGLGKLGGEELNFDSDLDVIFLYAPSTISEQVYHEVASGLIEKMSRVTGYGRLYAVDARLRPEGKNAPLATELNAFLAYLQKRALLWERQALIKAEFVGGNRQFAEKVLSGIEQFVYGERISPKQVGEIIAMRRKTESRIRFPKAEFIDIKVGAGGIVDIEFLVQTLQLMYGVQNKELRGRNTLNVLRGLRQCNFITENDFQTLEQNYIFFRETEKFMRISLETTASVLPSDSEKLGYLARCVGLRNQDEFIKGMKERMKGTREIFLRLMKQLQSTP